MKFDYYPDTDSLYIELSDKHVEDSHEVAPNIVFDYDAEGNVVGIDVYQYASKFIDLNSLEVHSVPRLIAA
ncbi:MAG: DUF2283 domain-containing protein [Bacteroidota bacterium]|nr:DUF2283 domain-containing protein [Bacteroidota bacterium]MDP4230599.1 DUF2283 domain-containing protein [Bacteroidota bacterium]MDP4235690.1 DUF2283 domain-containing protein [Bacteroidota bacterium]